MAVSTGATAPARRRHRLAKLLGQIETRVQRKEKPRLLEFLPKSGRRGEQCFGLARYGRNEHDAQAGAQREQREYHHGHGELARQPSPGQRFNRVVHGHGHHARSEREGDGDLGPEEEEHQACDGQHAEADGEDGLERDLRGGASRFRGSHCAVVPRRGPSHAWSDPAFPPPKQALGTPRHKSKHGRHAAETRPYHIHGAPRVGGTVRLPCFAVAIAMLAGCASSGNGASGHGGLVLVTFLR